MKFVIISIMVLILSACASTSEVNDIEQLVLTSQATVTKLDNKIVELEAERAILSEQLSAVEKSGQSLQSGASELKGKISTIDQAIGAYKNEITTINSTLSKNSKTIKVVKKQQKQQHVAASTAVKDNQILKDQVVDEIRALELEYEAKRKKLLEQQNPEKSEDNDGK